MKLETLYIAYGSNLNLSQMALRCPTAKVFGAGEIKDYELLFRGGSRSAVATVEPLTGAAVPVLLWKLKENDLLALDRYEGYPSFYRKDFISMDLNGKTVPAMIYIMNDGHSFGTPTDYYCSTILEGYQSAGFDTDFLEQAVEKSIRLAQEQHESESAQGTLFEQKWW